MDERGRGAVVVETPEKRHPREAWGKGGTAPVVLYQNIEFEDGATRRKARVLPFYSDATDEEIAAATLGSADENAYWSHFGSDFDAATEAGKKYEADGIPTKTSRHGGAQWASVTAAGIASEESKARTVESTEPSEGPPAAVATQATRAAVGRTGCSATPPTLLRHTQTLQTGNSDR